MADTPVFRATVAAVNRPPRPPKPVQLDMLHQLLIKSNLIRFHTGKLYQDHYHAFLVGLAQ